MSNLFENQMKEKKEKKEKKKDFKICGRMFWSPLWAGCSSGIYFLSFFSLVVYSYSYS